MIVVKKYLYIVTERYHIKRIDKGKVKERKIFNKSPTHDTECEH